MPNVTSPCITHRNDARSAGWLPPRPALRMAPSHVMLHTRVPVLVYSYYSLCSSPYITWFIYFTIFLILSSYLCVFCCFFVCGFGFWVFCSCFCFVNLCYPKVTTPPYPLHFTTVLSQYMWKNEISVLQWPLSIPLATQTLLPLQDTRILTWWWPPEAETCLIIEIPYISCNKLFSNSCLEFNLNYYKFVVLDVHTLPMFLPVLQVVWIKKRINVLGEKTGAQNIVKEIKQYQKKWLQHVQRMDTNRLRRQALKYRPEGRRNIGRPKKRWMDQLHFQD